MNWDLRIGTVARRSILAVFLVLTFGLLSACDSSEERAEKHYQSALALLEKGDEERAIVEFRNVFKLNGTHRDARTAYAKLQKERGNYREAIGQYTRLVEQYPDDLDGNRTLAEMYAEAGMWPEMERFLIAASAIDPDDKVIQALQIVFEYRNAVEDRDGPAAEAATAKAADLLTQLPDYIMIRQVIIDNQIQHSDFAGALEGLDQAIEIAPYDRRLYTVRLSVLGALGDAFGIEAQLKDMIARFKDDPSSRVTLVRWYVSQGQLDEAEDFLRDAVDPTSEDSTASVTLLRFLTELRGEEVALDELKNMIAGGATAPIFISLKAGLEFELGNMEQGISEMESLIAGMEPSDETNTMNISLSTMLLDTGNAVGARALIEDVLENDASQVSALKLKAAWLIDGDQVDAAVLALRTALDQTPRDPEIMTLLARAHERDGNQELVGEMLSLAVESSNRAPEESIRYAQYLSVLGKFGTAESILVDALRLAPSDYGILLELGSVYLDMEDWPRTQQVIDTLYRFDTPEGEILANELKAHLLQAPDNTAGAVGFLEELIADGSAGFEAKVAIVRAHLDGGDYESAREYVDSLLVEAPEDMGVQFMDAAIDAATGDLAGAEATYRAMLEKDDQQIQPWISLFRVTLADNRPEDAALVVDQAQAVFPYDPTLKWIKAGLLETAGDLDGAIEIYEDLYLQDSDNLIVANNLASLLTINREDPEIASRAYTIAKRLRLSPVPPYQDTYGWIAFLRGDFPEAIKALEPAAEALVTDPTVQYHLARAYVSIGRPDDAIIQYQKVLELTGAGDTRDFVTHSGSEISRLLKEQEKNDGN